MIIKILTYLVLITLFLSSLMTVCINIHSFFNNKSEEGTVFKIEQFDYSGHNQSSSYTTFYIKKEKIVLEGDYDIDKSFFIGKGDTVVYRRINFQNQIRPLKVNGKKVQNYYGPWDYLSLLILICMVLIYFYWNKFIKK
ncbi:hypothetical protein [Tenacibaculum caenipelagi]|uniref:DUF3592 domain-containing protein n=1 Tax=Tenacibaculum caenipelagi TaxID=1325435 RepID=A0A4R6TGN5_9FLAO|nr:hypothetical protein [Tenacibaculum caenipelagi]TDQ25818.1 hypothetical protein DFQ07_2249 [Tenacibaculum caenipelagi]